jgi:mRNA interferase MazF
MALTERPTPQRGELWYVDLNPTRGAEIHKERPCLVLSVPSMGKLPLRVTVPLTGWQDRFAGRSWLIQIPATQGTRLSKDSTVDALQVRGVELSRFHPGGPIGTVPAPLVEEVAAAVALVVGHHP